MSRKEESIEIAALVEKFGNCLHGTKLKVQRLTSNRSIQIVEQCLDCGKPIGSPVKKSVTDNTLPFFDKSIQVDRERQKESELCLIRNKYQEKKNAHSDSWWLQYNSYLLSPQWRSLREKVLARSSGVCEGCMDAKATQIHHLNYMHVFSEFLFELVAVCDYCHNRLHPPDISELDHLPCEGCQFQSTFKNGVPSCLKFETSAMDALSVGGPCGPQATALEPLK